MVFHLSTAGKGVAICAMLALCLSSASYGDEISGGEYVIESSVFGNGGGASISTSFMEVSSILGEAVSSAGSESANFAERNGMSGLWEGALVALVETPTPIATPTPVATPTATATATIVPTPVATPTAIATATIAPTPTATATIVPTPTATSPIEDVDNDGKPNDCETLDYQKLSQKGSRWTNMNLPDSDGDWLLDGQEDPGDCDLDFSTDTLAMTNPRNRDTDGDGLSDGVEVLILDTNPLDRNDPPPNSPGMEDMDGDGLPASIDPDDNNPDTDGDGYSDYEEIAYGSDPENSDSHPSLGDVDSNGEVNNIDSILLLNFILNNMSDLAGYGQCDVYVDGLINNMDALVLFNRILGSIAYLPWRP